VKLSMNIMPPEVTHLLQAFVLFCDGVEKFSGESYASATVWEHEILCRNICNICMRILVVEYKPATWLPPVVCT
jgi:hypothetical protein